MGVDSMTIQQCKHVVEIAKRGSFHEASKRLFIAQSSLSNSVKLLEDELNIVIFKRSNSGIYLTDEGAEFIRYATQIAEQHGIILERYGNNDKYEKLYVSTQHYDFVADVFGKLLKDTAEEKYKFALRETQTYQVIHEVETAYSDIGILAIKENDTSIMKRYLSKKGLSFTSFIEVYPCVFLRRQHPLADSKFLSYEILKKYPYVSYEQGEHNNSFFTEEIMNFHSNKNVEISDRATLMNVLISTDGYTIGTGIMPSMLNNGNVISVPFNCEEHYIIGYILNKNRMISPIMEQFINLLVNSMNKFKPC